MKASNLISRNRELFLKGVGYGVLGAVIGLILGFPLSLVKTGLVYAEICKPVLRITQTFWLTLCGFMFYDNTLGWIVSGLIAGIVLGFLGILFQRKVLQAETGVPKYRWSFLAAFLFVLLFLSVLWGM